jgi:hypothetical protein
MINRVSRIPNLAILLVIIKICLSICHAGRILDSYNDNLSKSTSAVITAENQITGIFLLVTYFSSFNQYLDIYAADKIMRISKNSKYVQRYTSLGYQSTEFTINDILFFNASKLSLYFPTGSSFTIWYFSDVCSSQAKENCSGICDSYCSRAYSSNYCWSSTNNLRVFYGNFLNMQNSSGGATCMNNPFSSSSSSTSSPTYSPSYYSSSSSSSDSFIGIFIGSFLGGSFLICVILFACIRHGYKCCPEMCPRNAIILNAQNQKPANVNPSIEIPNQAQVHSNVYISENPPRYERQTIGAPPKYDDEPIPYEFAVMSSTSRPKDTLPLPSAPYNTDGN